MRRVSTITVVAGLVLGLTACAGGGEPGREAAASTKPEARPTLSELYPTALEDMAALETLQVSGWIEDEGVRVDLEMQMSRQGDCQGHSEVGELGGFDVIGVDDGYLVKLDETFWRTQVGARADKVMAFVDGRWVSYPADEAKPFRQFCDLGDFLDNLGKADDDLAEVKGQPQKINGVDAWLFRETSSDGTPPPLVWISADAPHRILKVEDLWSATPGAFELAGFDEPFDAERPADSEVIDLAELNGSETA